MSRLNLPTIEINLPIILNLSLSGSRKFAHALHELESKLSSKDLVSSRIIADIYQNSIQTVAELGFTDQPTVLEVQLALRNKILGEKNLSMREAFWTKNRARVIIAEDGIVSLNKKDNEAFIETGKIKFTNFRRELRAEIVDNFTKKINYLSAKQIKEKLF